MNSSGMWAMNDPFTPDYEKEDLENGVHRVVTLSVVQGLWLQLFRGYTLDSVSIVPVEGPLFGSIRYKKKRVLVTTRKS